MKQLMFDWEQEEFAENSKYGVSLLHKVYQLRRILDFMAAKNIARIGRSTLANRSDSEYDLLRSPKSR